MFYLDKDSANESLLYDFNLVQGDTVKGYLDDIAEIWFGYNIDAVIDSVDSTLINSNYRRRWHYTTYDNFGQQIWQSGEIIEGIGSTYGLLEGLFPMFDYNGYLDCFSINNNPVYGGICTPASINEKRENLEIRIFPNPSENYIIVESKVHIIKIELIDSYGKELILTNENHINTENLKSGLYFLKIFTNKEVLTKRFIKN